ncbi:MAG TPA: HAD family phosphatase [Byssovorax sp.]
MIDPAKRFAPAALLLDMDGLMIDSEPLWFEVEREFVRARGGGDAWTDAMWRGCVGKGTPNTLAVMRDELGLAVDPAVDHEPLHDLFVARVSGLVFKAGLAELLDAASGRARLALASSSPARLVGAVLDRFELRSRFDAVVTGSDVARHKPAPDVFVEAARRLGVAAIDCLVLEDSLPGVTAARAAGMSVIAVPEGDLAGRDFDAVADAIVADLHEARARIDWR